VPVVEIKQIDGVLEMAGSKKSLAFIEERRQIFVASRSHYSSEDVEDPAEKLAIGRIESTKNKKKPKASKLVQNCRTKQNKSNRTRKKMHYLPKRIGSSSGLSLRPKPDLY